MLIYKLQSFKQCIVIINTILRWQGCGEKGRTDLKFFQQASTEQNSLYFKFQIKIL